MSSMMNDWVRSRFLNLLKLIPLSFYWSCNFISIGISILGKGCFMNLPVSERHLRCWRHGCNTFNTLAKIAGKKFWCLKSCHFYCTWISIKFTHFMSTTCYEHFTSSLEIKEAWVSWCFVIDVTIIFESLVAEIGVFELLEY